MYINNIELFNTLTRGATDTENGPPMLLLATLLLFFGVIIAFLGVAAYGAHKDKGDKLVHEKKQREAWEQANEYRVNVYGALKAIVDEHKTKIDEFNPMEAKETVGEISARLLDRVNELMKAESLKEDLYCVREYEDEIMPLLKQLASNKPASWSKNAFFAISVINNKYDALSKDKKVSKYLEQGKDKKYNEIKPA